MPWKVYWRGWNPKCWVWDMGHEFKGLYRFGPIGIADRRIL